MKNLPVFILERTPGADAVAEVPTREWLEICNVEHVGVHHYPFRETSRWVHVDRKRPFVVRHWRPRSTHSYTVSAHATLKAAIKSARKFATSIGA